jgi:hypothetical protein
VVCSEVRTKLDGTRIAVASTTERGCGIRKPVASLSRPRGPRRRPHAVYVQGVRETSALGGRQEHSLRADGKLRITVEQGYSTDGRAAEFRDTKTQPLEARLPSVLRELEVRALENEAKRREQRRQADEERRRWEQATETAKRDLREAHRAQVLKDQVERWNTARQLDAYLSDLRARTDHLDGDEKTAAEEWLTWATHYRDAIDPRLARSSMPAGSARR